MSISIPPSGPFTQMMEGYFGNYSTDVKTVIWRSFLETQGLTANPNDSDNARLQAFSNYVTHYYNNLLEPEVKFAEKTKVIWTVFDVLLLIMKSMTQTQITSQQLQTFLIKKQQEYRKEMARTVLYQGDPPGSPKADGDQTVTTPSSDPALFKLGYGDLTLKELLTQIVQAADQNYELSQRNVVLNGTPVVNNEVEFKLSRSPGQDVQTLFGLFPLPGSDLLSYITLKAKKTADNTYQLSVKFDTQERQYPNGLSQFFGGAGSSIVTITKSTDSRTVLGSLDTAITSLTSQFYGIYNQYKGTYWEVPPPPRSQFENSEYFTEELYQNVVKQYKSYNLRINWADNIKFSYVGNDNNLKNEFFKQSGQRGEFNKRAQSFIDANKSRADILKDFSEQQQRVVDAASNGRQQTLNILQGTVRQLQTILNSIFKR